MIPKLKTPVVLLKVSNNEFLNVQNLRNKGLKTIERHYNQSGHMDKPLLFG